MNSVQHDAHSKDSQEEIEVGEHISNELLDMIAGAADSLFGSIGWKKGISKPMPGLG